MIAALGRIARLIFCPDSAIPRATAEELLAPVASDAAVCPPVVAAELLAPAQAEIIDLVALRRARQVAATDREIAAMFG